MDALIGSMVESGHLTLAAFAIAIVALWRTLLSVTKKRVDAMERAIEACEEKHGHCEARNRTLSLAILDAIENRDGSARERCMAVLKGD